MSASIKSDPAPDMLAAALAYAAEGYQVFPCVPGTKVPLCEHGVKEATTNELMIHRWWTAEPTANIAWYPEASGLCVIDGDPPDGEQAFRDYCAEHEGFVPTCTIRTPRSGPHFIYTGRLWQTARTLIPGKPVDTRGVNSYGMLPPSRTADGPYRWEDRREPVTLPYYISNRALELRERHKLLAATGNPDIDLDQSVNLDRGQQHVAKMPVMKDGDGRNDATFKAAAMLRDYGLSQDTTLRLLAQWDANNLPPLGDELGLAVESAYVRAQNEHPGAKAVALASGLLGKVANDDKARVKRSRFPIEDTAMQDEEPDAAWLVPDILMDDDTTLLFGPMKEFKSFVALDIALSVATGLAGFAGKPARTGPVIWAANEGRKETGKPRRRAWMLAHGQPENKAIPFFTMPAPQAAVADDWNEFIAAIQDWCREYKIAPPALIVVDTVAKSMTAMNENSAQDVGIFLAMVERLREAFGCAVLCIHHTGLAERDRARGSSALPAGFANLLGVKGDKKKRTARVTAVANRGAAEREQPWELKGDIHGPALAFRVATAAEQRSGGGVREVPFYQVIMTALAKAGAFGEANALRRQDMARLLVGKPGRMTEGEFNSAVGAMAKKLDKGRERTGKDRMAPLAGCFGEVWNGTHRADGTPNTEIRFFRHQDPECWENPADWCSDEPVIG